jgi:mono/diheme cytochrome c family protein
MTSRLAWISLWVVSVASAGCSGHEQSPLADSGAEPPDAEVDAGDDSSVPDAEIDAAIDQQREGDPVRGRSLLLNNGTEEAPYLSCGVPRSILDGLTDAGLDPFADSIKLEERERGNAELPYDMSYGTSPSGVEIVTTNCLLCHAAKLGDSLIIGLGNPNADFASEGSGALGLSPSLVEPFAASLDADERAELERFSRVGEAAAEATLTDTIGMNPADVMFGVLAAHRDAMTLEWHDEVDPEAEHDMQSRVFTDVPAWWGMHRRDRMFYSGYGGGDHARIMMRASLLCVEDADEAAAIDAYFPDVAAFIESLRAPSYEDVSGLTIDDARAERGREVFVTTCTRCHGDAESGIDPVPSVSADEVGTDRAYAISRSSEGTGAVAYYFAFFNRSWYGTHGAAGRLERSDEPQYSPPPLDGVWATAPYFHNGSVPTLEAVLDPALRPAIFRRSFEPEDYDFESPGWPFEEVAKKGGDTSVYDTTRPSYGNGGHTFAAGLSADELRDLLEYLKTL